MDGVDRFLSWPKCVGVGSTASLQEYCLRSREKFPQTFACTDEVSGLVTVHLYTHAHATKLGVNFSHSLIL